jgi:hypothetical protein
MEANGEQLSKAYPEAGGEAWDGWGWSIAMDLSCIYGERREALLGSQAGCGNASNLGPIVKAAAAVFN